jgi:uncharacterized protein YxjI
MIYINLLFVVTSTYFLSVSENKPSIILHAMIVALNIMAVILHLSMR